MFKFNLLNDFLVLLVLINSLSFSQGLSDTRLCADPKCQKIISLGNGVINYSAGEKGMISFKIGSQIRVISKSSGSDLSLWGVEVNGRFGYVPRQYVRERKIYVKDEDLTFIVPVLGDGDDVSGPDKMPASESIPFVADNLKPTISLEEKLNASAAAAVEPLKMEVTETISPGSTEKSNNGIEANQTDSYNNELNVSENKHNRIFDAQTVEEKKKINIDNKEKAADDSPDNEDEDDDDDEDEDDDDEDDIIPSLQSLLPQKKLDYTSETPKKNFEDINSTKEVHVSPNSTDTLPKEIPSKSNENLILTTDKQVNNELPLKDEKEIKSNLEKASTSSQTLETLFIENENSTESLDAQTPSLVKNSETIVNEASEIVQNNDKIDEKITTDTLDVKEDLNDLLNLKENIEKEKLHLQNENTIKETIHITTKNDSDNVQSSAKVLDSIPIKQENPITKSDEKKNTIGVEVITEKEEVKVSKLMQDDNQNVNAFPNAEQPSLLKPFEGNENNVTEETKSTLPIQDSYSAETTSAKSEPTLLKEKLNESKQQIPIEAFAETPKDLNEGTPVNELGNNEPSIKISINKEKKESLEAAKIAINSDNIKESLGADIPLEKTLPVQLDESLPLKRKDPIIPPQQLKFTNTDEIITESPQVDFNIPQNNVKNPSESNFDNAINSGSSVPPQKTETLSPNDNVNIPQNDFRNPPEAFNDKKVVKPIQSMPSLPPQEILTETPDEIVNIPQTVFNSPAESTHDNANKISNEPSGSATAPSPAQEMLLERPTLSSAESIKYDANIHLYDEIDSNVNNVEQQQQVFEFNKAITDDVVKRQVSTNYFKEDSSNIDKTNPNNINSDFVSEFSQRNTDDFYSDNFVTGMPPNAFFDSLTESSLSNSLKEEEKRRDKHPKPTAPNIYNSEEYKKHGLFANILETVKNFIPNDNKLSEYIGEKIENRYCSSSAEPNIMTFDGFMNAFANKVLEMADLVSLLGIVAGTLLCFTIGYYVFCNSNRESNLIAKLNLLERSMLATNKENSILKHDLVNTRTKLLSIEDSSFGSNDMVISLKQNLEEKTSEIEKLNEQVCILEKELETATEAGLELNKMVSEMLNNQSGEDTIINSVEELQHQLNEQERTILEINTNLASKSRENSELQLQLVEQKAQLGHQITVLQNDNDELESEKSVLQSRLSELKSEFDQDITKALEGKNMEIRRLQSEFTVMQQRLEDLSNQLQSSDAKVKTFEECITNLTKDSKDNVEDVIDFANVKSQLLDMQNKYSSLKDSSQNQKEKLASNEGQIQAMSAELEQVKEQFHQSEKDKLEAQTRLEVLSSYFKEKEAQLQKELSQKESMWFKQQGEAVSTVERLTSMQDEIQSLKSQNDALRAEIEAQIAAHKAQIGTLENRAHETWLSARQADRRCEEAKAEAASLRHKLTSLATNAADNALNMGLPDGSNNSEMKMMPPLGVEPPGSPVLFPLPQFLPPHFMGPPPPGFMSLPPFMTPGDIRPAPLGRIMSPLPQHPNPASRYSDYDPDYLPYDDDLDDDDDDLKQYRLNDEPLRHSRYSPPRTYRSHSPSDSRYDFDISLDCISNPYDTETNVSPPPSPRRGRSWRSDEYDRHSPPPSISSPKYERRKNTTSLKKSSSKNDR